MPEYSEYDPINKITSTFRAPAGLDRRGRSQIVGEGELDYILLTRLAPLLFSLDIDCLTTTVEALIDDPSYHEIRSLSSELSFAGKKGAVLSFSAEVVTAEGASKSTPFRVFISDESQRNQGVKNMFGDLRFMGEVFAQRVRPEVRKYWNVVQVISRGSAGLANEFYPFYTTPIIEGLFGLSLDIATYEQNEAFHMICFRTGKMSSRGEYLRDIWEQGWLDRTARYVDRISGGQLGRFVPESEFYSRFYANKEPRMFLGKLHELVDFMALLHVSTRGYFPPYLLSINNEDIMVKLNRKGQSSFLLTQLSQAMDRPTFSDWQRAGQGLSDEDWIMAMRDHREYVSSREIEIGPFEDLPDIVFDQALQNAQSFLLEK